jgi:hypothetical protein
MINITLLIIISLRELEEDPDLDTSVIATASADPTFLELRQP